MLPLLVKLTKEFSKYPTVPVRVINTRAFHSQFQYSVCGKLQPLEAAFPTGQVGQAAAKPGLAYGNSLGPGLARAYRLSTGCLMGRAWPI